jgi:hypothetical protein
VVWPQNHSDGFRRFGLKTGGDGFWRFGLKTCCDGFLCFGLKTSVNDFLQFGLKTVATVSPSLASKSVVGFLIEPQNPDGGGFPSLALKTGSSSLVIWHQNHCDAFLVWVSKSSVLRFISCATKPTKGGRRGTRVEI